MNRSVSSSMRPSSALPARTSFAASFGTRELRAASTGMLILCVALLILAATASDAMARLPRVDAADAARSLPDAGPVRVHWRDPAGFTEIRASRNRIEAARGDWVEELAQHLRARAQRRLARGERLDVELIDIDRAGDFEPWQALGMQDTRVLRDIYPPRITLHFTRTDAAGTVLAQGERRLVDPMFLSGPGHSTNDPLRYEKRLIDQWLSREFGAP